MRVDATAPRSVVLRLHLHEQEDCLLVGANTDPCVEGELVRLSPAEVEALARLGERLAKDGLCERSAVERAGEALFATVFRGSVLETFLAAKQEAARRGTWLRILVSLPPRTALHEIPWEILFHRGRFLACSKVSIGRYVRQLEAAPTLSCEPPARMLMTSAEPREAAKLWIDAEEAEVRKGVAAAKGRIRLDERDVHRHVSRDQLIDLFAAARRRGEPFRIWHHAGHGGMLRSGRFAFVLEKNGSSQVVEGARLAPVIAAESDLKLVVLSLCFGGSSLGLGVDLARLDVPAVVAFRGSLMNSTAVRFAASFYQELAAGPVDEALGRARNTLGVVDDLDWTQPILYARAKRLSLRRRAAGSPAKPAGGTAPVFHNRGVRVRRKTQQIAPVLAAGDTGRAGPVFLNEDLDTGDLVQVGLGAESAGEFAERWRDLLDHISAEPR